MLKVSVNTQMFDIQSDNSNLLVNNEVLDWDLVKISEGKFHILYDSHSYNAEVLEADYEAKSFKIKLNNNSYLLSAKDRFDVLLEQLGMGDAASAKVNDLKAPMPGLIVEIKVQVGDSIKKGDTLLILEAMKMENVLKSVGDGKVKTIKVSPKQNVEKNQILIEFE
jgi:biotin carboxyl carrier protein